MTVEVRVPALLQKHVGGSRTVRAEGGTVGHVLESLERQYPGFKERIITEKGTLHRFVNVYLNNEDIRFLGELEAPVADGDVISILPAIAGGGGIL